MEIIKTLLLHFPGLGFFVLGHTVLSSNLFCCRLGSVGFYGVRLCCPELCWQGFVSLSKAVLSMLLFCYLGLCFVVNVVLFSLRFGCLVQNHVGLPRLDLGCPGLFTQGGSGKYCVILNFLFVIRCFFSGRHRFRPQNITSGTCIITSRDLHHHFQGPALFLLRTCIIASKDLHHCFRPALFYRNLPVQKNKTNGRKWT